MNKKFDIIYAPIITEKTAMLAQNENKYAFKVDPRANKTEIKQAIESIFNVKVLSITTANSHPKKKRVSLLLFHPPFYHQQGNLCYSLK